LEKLYSFTVDPTVAIPSLCCSQRAGLPVTNYSASHKWQVGRRWALVWLGGSKTHLTADNLWRTTT